MGDKKRMDSKDTLIITTSQSEVVIKKLLDEGAVFSKKEYLKSKYEESYKIFYEAYTFLAREMKSRIPLPKSASMPYFGFINEKLVERYPGNKILILEVPMSNLVYFDMYDWNVILSLNYLGEERETFNKMLIDMGIKNVSDVFLTDFYPLLKREIIESWKNLFRFYDRNSMDGIREVELSMFQIKKEWIMKIK